MPRDFLGSRPALAGIGLPTFTDVGDLDGLERADASTAVVEGLAVTANSTDRVLAVAAGSSQHTGVRQNVAAGTATIGANGTGSPRIDLVSISPIGAITVTAGTADPYPRAPAAPADHVPLAEVYVAAGATALVPGNVADRRVVMPVVGVDYRRSNYALLRRHYAALGDRERKPYSLAFLGDSLVVGGFSTTFENRFTAQIADGLQRMFKGTGSRWVSAGQWQTPWIFTGGSLSSTAGMGEYARVMTGTTQTAVIARVTDQFDLYFTGSAGTGSVEVLIDGVSQGTFSTTLGTLGVVKLSFSTTLANHTITVRPAVAGHIVYLSGGYFYAGDAAKGVRVYDVGHSGHTAADLARWTASGSDAYTALANTHFSADCVVVECGLNDQAGAVAASTFKTNLTTVVANIRAACEQDPSIIILGLWARCDGTYTEADWQPYRNAMREVAIETGCVFYDMHELSGWLGATGPTHHTGVTTSGTTITIPDGFLRNPLDVGVTVQIAGQTSRTISAVTNGTTATLNSAVDANQAGTAIVTLTNRKDPNLLTTDGLHPSDAGHRWLADEFARQLAGIPYIATIPQGIFNNAGEFIKAKAADQAIVVPGVKTLSAQVNNSTVTPADITDLRAYGGSGDIWFFEWLLYWQSAATTTGIGISVTCPAGALISYTVETDLTVPAAAASTALKGMFTASGGELLTTSIDAATTRRECTIKGQVIFGNTAGYLTPRFRSEVAGSQVSILVGSSARIL